MNTTVGTRCSHSFYLHSKYQRQCFFNLPLQRAHALRGCEMMQNALEMRTCLMSEAFFETNRYITTFCLDSQIFTDWPGHLIPLLLLSRASDCFCQPAKSVPSYAKTKYQGFRGVTGSFWGELRSFPFDFAFPPFASVYTVDIPPSVSFARPIQQTSLDQLQLTAKESGPQSKHLQNLLHKVCCPIASRNRVPGTVSFLQGG